MMDLLDRKCVALLGSVGLAFGLLIPSGKNSSYQASAQAISDKSEIQIYGQVPNPNQIQKNYLVFEKIDQKIVGAYYQPLSEFSCFVGERDGGHLDLQIFASYGPKSSSLEVSLQDLYSLPEVSKNDRRMLKICRSIVSDVV